jgi:4-amino-4-deoxy-L-arabinose transferase-like glycosyltransferase
MTRKRFNAILPATIIFIIAILVRILFNFTVARNYTPINDSANYQAVALSILHQHCFCLLPPPPIVPQPTVDRAPLWPLTIAIIYGLFGPQNLFVRLFLSVVGAGTCVFVYLFAREIFDHFFAMLAGLAAAFYPQLYVYDGWLASESLFIFLLLAVCYTVLRFQRTQKLGWIISAGILLGILSLERPNGLFVLGVFIVWAIVAGWRKLVPRKLLIKGSVLATLIAFILIAPWTIRNYIDSHTFIPVAIGQGTVLIGAYNSSVLGGNPPAMWVNPNIADPALGEKYRYADWQGPAAQLARERDFQNAAVQWILQHPNDMPFMLEHHFINMWGPTATEPDLAVNRYTNQRSTQIVLSMIQYDIAPILLLALLGFFLMMRRRWHELLFMYLVILMTMAQCVAIYGSPRFRAPIEPMIILLAVGAIWWFKENYRIFLWNSEVQAGNSYSSSDRSSGSNSSSSSESSSGSSEYSSSSKE